MAVLREMTDEQKAVVIAVTQHLINMLYNDIIKGNGIESFEGWCEDGDVFDKDRRDKCIELMHDVSPIIDDLTFNHLNLGY